MYKNHHKGCKMISTDQEVYNAVKHYLPTVNEYIKSHGGKIKLLGVKDDSVYIELSGACHVCAMSLMTTKLVVEKSLREFIGPKLNVINIDNTPANKLPLEYYIEENDKTELGKSKKDKFMDAIKKLF